MQVPPVAWALLMALKPKHALPDTPVFRSRQAKTAETLKQQAVLRSSGKPRSGPGLR